MHEKRWTFVDKSDWPTRGPWDSEPDKVQWTDDATGLPCLALRARSHWCGYVGVTEGHPAFGKGDEAVDVDVHGSITFTGACDEGGLLCHIPEPGQSDRVWWLGFDCAHWQDLDPIQPADHYSRELGVYRTLEYVQAECASLAEQLRRIQDGVGSSSSPL